MAPVDDLDIWSPRKGSYNAAKAPLDDRWNDHDSYMGKHAPVDHMARWGVFESGDYFYDDYQYSHAYNY